MAEQCWARSRSRPVPGCQIEFTSKLDSDQLLLPPCHHSRAWANNPTLRDVRSFEVNTGRRRRETWARSWGQVFLYLWVCRASEQIWFGIQFDTEGGKLASTLLYILFQVPHHYKQHITSPHKTKTKNIRFIIYRSVISSSRSGYFALVGSLSCDGDNNAIMRAECGGWRAPWGVSWDRLRL